MSFQGQAQTAPYAVEVLSDAKMALKCLRALIDWADDIYFAYAWISSAGGTAEHWKALDLTKVRKAVVGLDFNRTEPRALEILHREAPAALRIVSDTSGVFHPKIIVGVRGKVARAIVGSSNFTKGGFGSNSEMNLALEGPSDAAPLCDLLSFVNAQWSGLRATEFTDEWLSEYKIVYRARLRPEHVSPPGVVRAPGKWVDLNMSWSKYFSLVAAQDGRLLQSGLRVNVFDADGNSYLEEMEFCQDVFVRNARFEDIGVVERKHVAGFGTSTGFFGTTVPAGYFKEMVIKAPEELAALDLLPLEGAVSFSQALSITEALMAVPNIGLGTATRLLSVKRPDVFLPVNNANRARIKALYGKAPSTARSYVEMLESIWAMPWWKAAEPKDPVEARVWRGRVALLDAVVYG